MNKSVVKAGVAVFFVGLLAFPVVDRYLQASETRSQAGLSQEDALSRYGFYLEEVGASVGIDFEHEAPVLDAKLDHIMPQVASMGAAVSVVDYDRDGWQDLYVTSSKSGAQNGLYRNLGDGTFEDVAESVGIANVNREGTGVSMGAVWGDYDNDGFEDLFLYKWGRSELYHNDGGEGFSRVTEGAGFPEWANVNAGIWLDYDRDGHLDVFFGSYYPEDINLWDLEHTRIMPESFEYAGNGGRKYLLKGHGDGTFEDVTVAMGLADDRRWMMAVSAADLRGTGYPDLFIANDYGADEVYFNQEGRGFVEAGAETQVGHSPKSGMNVAFGDLANEGAFSVYVTNISEPGVLVQGNNLWVPDRGAEGVRYRNMASTLNVEMGGWSYGAQFGDLNNDGRVDLFATNGYVSADRQGSYWYDFSKVAGGNASIISDARNWPAMEGRSLSGYQLKKVWLNSGQWRFQQVGQAIGVNETFDGRSVVLVDLWNRGVLDVVVAHQRGPLLVYRNAAAASDRNWVEFELAGTQSNRSAIGAQVELYWNDQRQLQQVTGGTGFCSQNQRRVHFGLGPGAQIEKAVIRWPSGRSQTLTDVEPGTIHKVTEPA